jgi:hypothetical protein
MVKRRFRPPANMPVTTKSPHSSSPSTISRQPSRLFPASPTAKLLDVVSARVDQGGVQRRAIGRTSPTRPNSKPVGWIPMPFSAYILEPGA